MEYPQLRRYIRELASEAKADAETLYRWFCRAEEAVAELYERTVT